MSVEILIGTLLMLLPVCMLVYLVLTYKPMTDCEMQRRIEQE